MFSVKVHAMENMQTSDDCLAKAPPPKDLASPRLGSSEITELTEEPESTRTAGDKSRDGDPASLGDIIVGQMKFPASAGSASASTSQAAGTSAGALGGSGAGEITEEPEGGAAPAHSVGASSSYEEGAGAVGLGSTSLQRVAFSSGNPRVECWKGAVHLFRNTSEPPGTMAKFPVSFWRP